ncbi:FAD-binding protein [Rhodobacteraceae bacterium CCMM004]|nr:FAD-binding protein [Rhodobacteraceae bacterium CCMM004]
MEQDADILVSGAGIAGMIAAAGLAHAGWRVVLVDPAPPPKDAEADGSDLRATAYLHPSVELFQRLGLWNDLAPHATPLAALEVIDTQGWPPEAQAARIFTAHDLGLPVFGWNLPNWLTRRRLGDLLADLPGLDLRFGTGVAGLFTRTTGARVDLSDGSRLGVRLIVGADGRASTVRAAHGIGTQVRRYGQKALAFAAVHDRPHADVSVEIYNVGGAFTTVPLPDHDGRPASAIVWMNDGPRAQALMEMAGAPFGDAMTTRAMGRLGRMDLASPRRIWPVVTQTAARLTAERTALIAEAAHVLPPIGAQGLNTSLADVAALLSALDGATDPGAPAVLDRYARARARDVALRARAIDLFNRVCKSDAGPAHALRRAGLAAVHDIAALRQAVMHAGMGAAFSGGGMGRG